MNDREALNKILNNKSSRYVCTVPDTTVTEAPNNKPLLVVSDMKYVNSDGDLTTIPRGTVFTKPSGKKLYHLYYGTGVEPSQILIPSFIPDGCEMKNEVLHLDRLYDEYSVTVLDQIKQRDVHIYNSSLGTIADDKLTFMDVESIDTVISDCGRVTYEVKQLSTNKFRVTAKLGDRKIATSSNIEVNWIDKPIKNSSDIIRKYIEMNNDKYLTNNNIKIKMRMELSSKYRCIDLTDFEKQLFSLVDIRFIQLGNYTPSMLSIYLHEYLGYSMFDTLVDMYKSEGLTEISLKRYLDILPNRLHTFSEVIEGVHLKPKKSRGKTRLATSSIFNNTKEEQ